jgi:hypothetical protein
VITYQAMEPNDVRALLRELGIPPSKLVVTQLFLTSETGRQMAGHGGLEVWTAACAGCLVVDLAIHSLCWLVVNVMI